MAVQTDLVKEFLVARIHGWVVAHYFEEPVPGIETMLVHGASHVLGDVERDLDSALAGRIARAGYLARTAETALFEPARQPALALVAKLDMTASDPGPSWTLISAQAARAEPVDRPDVDDPRAMSWRVPGPGGHVRHYAALEAIKWLSVDPSGDALLRLKRPWLYGFFMRCCADTAVQA